MEINNWFSGCLVQAFPWIDGKYIYVNVRRFLPGQSISQAPAWDRAVFVLDDEPGRTIVYKYTDSLVNAISSGKILDKSRITFDNSQYFI
jgi:hypothetical protein